MSALHPQPSIPRAQAGPISDTLLEQLHPIATAIRDNTPVNNDQGLALILCMPGIINELLHRRRAMDVICDMTDLNNVHFLSPSEDPRDA